MSKPESPSAVPLKPLRYLSVCSGIEAATVAWKPLGWEAVAFAEIDKFPTAVLKHHYPGVPNWGDLTKFKEWPDADVDVLVGGTPCQSFSVAGLRAGLADPRGNLALTYLAVVDRYRPRWVVWENVPGVLSADDGGALGALLGGLGELGYGFAYRVLDAQYFGLAQRRARVFVVGHLEDWRRAAAVLFERASLSGHPAPRREAGKDVAGTLGGSSQSGGFRTTDLDNSGAFIPVVGNPVLAGGHATNPLDETLIAGTIGAHTGIEAQQAWTGRLVPIAFQPGNLKRGAGADPNTEVFPSLLVSKGSGTSDQQPHVAVAFAENQRAEVVTSDTAGSLKVGGGKPGQGYPAVQAGMQVRRLTPRECERLQGFPDDYTLIPYRGKPAADGPRYKALGNSMAVPVMAWIGLRIQLAEDLELSERLTA